MTDIEGFGAPENKGITRRTVMKGAAWAVPVVALASSVPAYAASPTPGTPVFDWGAGCATVGNTKHGCAQMSTTPQVPFTVTTPTGKTLGLQILGVKSWTQNGTEPTTWAAPTGVWTNNNGSQDNCSPEVSTTKTCSDPTYPGAVTVAVPGSGSYWLVGSQQGNSSAFYMSVLYQWIDTNTCSVVQEAAQLSANSISSSTNCGQ